MAFMFENKEGKEAKEGEAASPISTIVSSDSFFLDIRGGGEIYYFLILDWLVAGVSLSGA